MSEVTTWPAWMGPCWALLDPLCVLTFSNALPTSKIKEVLRPSDGRWCWLRDSVNVLQATEPSAENGLR